MKNLGFIQRKSGIFFAMLLCWLGEPALSKPTVRAVTPPCDAIFYRFEEKAIAEPPGLIAKWSASSTSKMIAYLAISADGSQVLAGDASEVWAFNTAQHTDKAILVVPGKKWTAQKIKAFSADGSTVAIAEVVTTFDRHGANYDERLFLYDLTKLPASESPRPIPETRTQNAEVKLSADGSKLLRSYTSREWFQPNLTELQLLDSTDFSLIRSFGRGLGGPIAISPDGNLVSYNHGTHKVVIEGVQEGTRPLTIPSRAIDQTDVAFTADGSHLVITGFSREEEPESIVVDLSNGLANGVATRSSEIVQRHIPFVDQITAMALSADNSTLALGFGNGVVRIIDLSHY